MHASPVNGSLSPVQFFLLNSTRTWYSRVSRKPVFLSRNHVKPQARVNDGLASTVPPASVVDGLRSPQPPASSSSVLATSELSSSFPHLTSSSELSDDCTVAGRGRYEFILQFQIIFFCSSCGLVLKRYEKRKY